MLTGNTESQVAEGLGADAEEVQSSSKSTLKYQLILVIGVSFLKSFNVIQVSTQHS